MTFNVSPFVIVESPYKGTMKWHEYTGTQYDRHLFRGTTEYNERYARACIRDCILRGEAPFASHLLYTQPGVLRDDVPEERELGMGLGWHVMQRANLVVMYTDLGWSSGMIRGFNAAMDADQDIDIRRLGDEWSGGLGDSNYANFNTVNPEMRIVSENVAYHNRGYIEIDGTQGYGAAWSNAPGEENHIEILKASFKIVRH